MMHRIFLALIFCFCQIEFGSTHFGIESIDRAYVEAFFEKKYEDADKRGEHLDRILGHLYIEKIEPLANLVKNRFEIIEQKAGIAATLPPSTDSGELKKLDANSPPEEWVSKVTILMSIYNFYYQNIFKNKNKIQIERRTFCQLWWILESFKQADLEIDEELIKDESSPRALINNFHFNFCFWFDGKERRPENSREEALLEQINELLDESIISTRLESLKSLVGTNEERKNMPSTLKEVFREKKLENESELAFHLRVAHIQEYKIRRRKGLNITSLMVNMSPNQNTNLQKPIEQKALFKKSKKKNAKVRRTKLKKQEVEIESENRIKCGIQEAKSRIQKTCKSKFDELMETNPFALAIDIYENYDLEHLYINLLSVSQFNTDEFKTNIHEQKISLIYLLNKIWIGLIEIFEKEINFEDEEEMLWRNIAELLPKITFNFEKKEKFLLSLADAIKKIYKKIGLKLDDFMEMIDQNELVIKKTYFKNVASQLPSTRSMLLPAHAANLIKLWEDKKKDEKENLFKKFLSEEKGPRGRLVLLFGSWEMIVQCFTTSEGKGLNKLLIVEYNDIQMDKQLIENYKLRLDFSISDWERERARIWTDILVQYKMANEFFEKMGGKKGVGISTNNWHIFKADYLNFLDRLTDFTVYNDWVKEKELEMRNTLFKIKQLKNQEIKHWDLFAILTETKQNTMNLQELEMPEVQEYTLKKLHAETILRLIKNDAVKKSVKIRNKKEKNNANKKELEEKSFLDFLVKDLDVEGDKILEDIFGRWPKEELGREFGQNAKGPIPFELEFPFHKESSFLVNDYKSLLEKDVHEWNGQTLKHLLADANIFYYKYEFIRQLLESANSFGNNEMIKNEITAIKLALKENMDGESTFGEQDKHLTLCRLHSFLIIQIYKNKIFIENIEGWNEICQKIEKVIKNKFEYKKQVIEGNCDDIKNEENMEMSNASESEKFIQSLLIDGIHKKCIAKLLESPLVTDLSEFFASNGNLRLVKQRIRHLVGENALRQLEADFPSILSIENSNSQHLLQLYKSYLIRNENECSAPIDQNQNQLDTFALLFHLEHQIGQIKALAGNEFPNEMDQMNKRYEEMMEVEAKSDILRRICKILEFLGNIVKNEQLAEDDRWKHMLDKLYTNSPISKSNLLANNNKISNNICEIDEHVKEVIKPWLKPENISVIHFFSIKQLSMKSTQLLDLFSNNFRTYKQRRSRLVHLLDADNYTKLQTIFPIEMHFVLLLPEKIKHLYFTILINQFGSTKSMEAELLLATSTLCGKLLELERTVYHLSQLHLHEDPIFRALKTKIPEIVKSVYSKREQMVSMESICVLYHSLSYFQLLVHARSSALNKGGDTVLNVSEQDIANWSTVGHCTSEQQQLRAFDDQRNMLRDLHFDKIEELLHNGELEPNFLNTISGIQHRLKRFVGPAKGTILIVEHKLETHEVMDNPLFLRLDGLYKRALADQNIDERVLNKLKLNIHFLVKWADLKKYTRKSLAAAWLAHRERYVKLYDQLCDTNVEEVRANASLWLDEKIRWMELQKFMQINSDELNKNKIKTEEKMKDRLEKIATYKRFKFNNNEDPVINADYDKWQRNFHEENLLALFSQRNGASFIEKMHKALRKREDMLLMADLDKLKAEEVAKLIANLMENEENEFFKPIIRERVEAYRKKELRKIRKIEEKEEEESLSNSESEDSKKAGETEAKSGQSKTIKQEQQIEESTSEYFSSTDLSRKAAHHSTHIAIGARKSSSLRRIQVQRQSSLSSGSAQSSPDGTPSSKRASRRRNSGQRESPMGQQNTAEAETSANTPKRQLKIKEGEKEEEVIEKMRLKQEQQRQQQRAIEVREIAGGLGLPDQIEAVAFVKGKQIIGEEGSVIESISADELLDKSYMEFVLQPDNNERKLLLEIGTFANEIWHRLDVVEYLMGKGVLNVQGDRDNEKWLRGVKKRWRHLLTNRLAKTSNNNVEALEEIKPSLQNLLWKIVKLENHTTAEKLGKKNKRGQKNVIIDFDEEQEMEENERKISNERAFRYEIMAKKLHWNRMANALSIQKQYSLIWDQQLRKEERQNIFISLFNLSEEQTLGMMERFSAHLVGWNKMLEQTKMDLKSADNFVSFNLHYQQIDYQTENFAKAANSEPISKALIGFLDAEGLLRNDEHGLLKKTVKKVRNLVRQWNKGARLLISGSFALNVHAKGSDIDCIVLVGEPKEEQQSTAKAQTNDDGNEGSTKTRDEGENPVDKSKRRFFGEKQSICDLNHRDQCRDDSFYCILCGHNDVTFLRKITAAKIPLIQLIIGGIDFDLQFVSVPEEILKNMPGEERPNVESIDKLIGKFAVHIEEIKAETIENVKEDNNEEVKQMKKKMHAMLRSLSGYRSTIKIKELLEGLDKKSNNFRIAVLAIKQWAKTHSIYGSNFGFLNGTILSIMVCKIVLLNPGASIAYLIEQFLMLMLAWEWPNPIRLEDNIGNSLEKMLLKKYGINESHVNWAEIEWSAQKEVELRKQTYNNDRSFYQRANDEGEENRFAQHAQLIWPIVTPAFPTQNAGYNINHSTRQIMQREIETGLERVFEVKKRAQMGEATIEEIQREWQKWMKPKEQFIEKYNKFFLLACVAPDEQANSTFCDFAETGIRQQLVYKMEAMSGIRFCHVSKLRKNIRCPESIKMAIEKLRERHLSDQSRCTIWLAGIEREGGANIYADNSRTLGAFDMSFERNFFKVNIEMGARLDLHEYYFQTFFVDKYVLNTWLPKEV